jgi:DnaJ-domain-containing protein 1
MTSRVDDVLHLLESHAGSAIRPGAHPSDDALLTLLVHMAFSDGVFEPSELAMLRKVAPLPDDEALQSWVHGIVSRPLDLEQIAAALDTDDRRWTALRYAARMAWKDEDLAPSERAFLNRLCAACELPPSALDRVLREMSGPPAERLDAEALRTLLDSFQWDAAQMAEGPVASTDLVPMVPPGATPVARIGVDHAEVLGLYQEGIVARFLEGPAFVYWREIISFNHGVGLESSVRIHTEDGRIWSLIDARLGALSLLFDRLFRPTRPRPKGPKPRIERLTGRTWDDSDEP